MTTKSPEDVDIQVGKILRARRRELGISQSDLAAVIGVSFQQVQKYENGANRLSASRMKMAAGALNMEPGDFFLGVGDGDRPAPAMAFLEVPGAPSLVRAYLALTPTQRDVLVRVAQAMLPDEDAEPGRAYVAGGDLEAPRYVA